VLTVTVQEACGAEPLVGETEPIAGVPVTLLIAKPKLAAATFFTGLLKVTVQCSGEAFVGFASARSIAGRVGGVRSIVHVYEIGALVCPEVSFASTRNVWAPAGSGLYAFGLVQALYDEPSSEQTNVTLD
jgi:hypothetical protein